MKTSPDLLSPGQANRNLAFLVLGLSFLLPGMSRAENVVPKTYSENRYELIWKKSPFSLPSVAEENPDGFAANLTLAGITKFNDQYVAIVLDKSTQKRSMVTAKPNSDGLALVEAQTSKDLKEVSVVVQKNGESATLKYDLAFFQAATPAVAANPNPGQAPNSIPSPGTRPPMGTSSSPTPNRIFKRRIIPANQNANGQTGTAPRPTGSPQPANIPGKVPGKP